jgi:hypothetical protein
MKNRKVSRKDQPPKEDLTRRHEEHEAEQRGWGILPLLHFVSSCEIFPFFISTVPVGNLELFVAFAA